MFVGKLVRDRIPDIMRAKGLHPEIRVMEEADFLTGLLDKLLEEAQELKDASPEHRLEEAADVHEVFLSVCAVLGYSVPVVEAAAARKRDERGAFEQRIWLERW